MQKENMDGGSADMGKKTQKLKPCPMCGSDDIKIHHYPTQEIMMDCVMCRRCGLKIERETWLHTAIAAWNRRAPQCEKE
ncbi:TPA: Lar family restriction alleviation protein [Morganella morganii]|nr:Lar family restriction alleviation protein [Morganella morganii]